MTITESMHFFQNSQIISALIRLYKVGLGYITLGQSLDTFSGGECQRLKLAVELKARGKIYVFDEPTTGLHGLDIQKLLVIFDDMVDNENSTVVIVEHNLDVISQSDWIIEIGPKAGKEGGKLIYSGFVRDIINTSSVTGLHLKNYGNEFY